LLLLWPAFWNGYPIVFADTGTYLSQAVHRYAGWDRPVFYSLVIYPLHATLTLWPVVIAQALLAAWVLRRACIAFAPRLSARAFVAGCAALAALTWLPWLVSEVMPDLFTPLLVLLLALLPRASGRERAAMVLAAAGMIAAQQSSLPLAFALAACGAARHRRWRIALLPPALAALAMCSVNLAAHGRFALSPFGNVFLLARLVADGPARDALQRDCPAAGWRLCPYADALPADADAFLWAPDSPLLRAGGAKAVSAEADAIIAAALRAEPAAIARAAVANALAQLARFDSGDGTGAWPAQVTPWLRRDFPPAENARYDAARQQNGALAVPAELAAAHRAVALAGVAACLALLPLAVRRRSGCAALLAVALVALPVGAAVTGALSGPHDRYQARLMWLPPFAAAVAAAASRRRA
jgi:hypothetical protein